MIPASVTKRTLEHCSFFKTSGNLSKDEIVSGLRYGKTGIAILKQV